MNPTDNFDFDYWMNLAKSDPVRFEQERTKATRAVIESAPSHLQHRLEQLQWKVDMIRQTSSTPLSALY